MACNSKRPEYDPDTHIPDLSCRVFFITGGTAGLGKETLLRLARHNPAHIYFTGRNKERGDQVIAAGKLHAPSTEFSFVQLDMLSLASIKDALVSLNIPRLDALLCNAGVMAIDPALSKDGYEAHWAVNHMAHACILKHLLPSLEATAQIPGASPRVVFVTSLAAKGFVRSEGIQFDAVRTTMESGKSYMVFDRWFRYGHSKLANILYPAELSRRYPNIIAVAIHPGVSNTELVSTLPKGHRWFVKATTLGQMKPANVVTWNSLWATTASPEDVKTGEFYLPVGKADQTEAFHLKDKEMAAKLWDWTQKELEEF